jgi:2-methylisoborneol synthase
MRTQTPDVPGRIEAPRTTVAPDPEAAVPEPPEAPEAQEVALAPDDPDASAERLMDLLSGPHGIGTHGTRLPGPPRLTAMPATATPVAAVSDPPESPKRIKGLYCPPAVRDDRALADEVNARLVDWAEREVNLYPDADLRAALLGFDAGRSVVLCHPDAPGIDHLMVAARLLIAENAVDDYYCEVEYGGTADRRGAALVVAQSMIDPPHNTPRYESDWRTTTAAHPALRAMRSAMDYFHELGTPAQAHRYRHDIANLYLGYNAEGDCIAQERTPAVWEYLVQRQFNSFRPCLTLTDTVGGYELPAHLYADPGVQRAVGLAANASTICNDLYSLRKEQASERFHYSLPTVIAAEERCSIHEAFDMAIEVHNELVHLFEEQAAALAADPVVARFMAGLSNWVGGNHEWHSGNVGTRYATSP